MANVLDVRSRIWGLDTSSFEGLKTWLVSCQRESFYLKIFFVKILIDRTIKVWQRKDIYRIMSPIEED
jgi:hypothetical protein